MGYPPFSLTHGRPPRLGIDHPGDTPARGPGKAGAQIAERLRQARQWAQTAIAAAQEHQERNANRGRRPATAFKVGDKVWLSLRNQDEGQGIFAPRNGLFTVLEVVGPRSYRLDTAGAHNVFHTDLLRPAGTDPFEHQQQDNWRPDPVTVSDENGDEQLEFEIEKIVKEGTYRGKPAFQVKWRGYNKLEWTDAENMEGTSALDDWRAAQRQ